MRCGILIAGFGTTASRNAEPNGERTDWASVSGSQCAFQFTMDANQARAATPTPWHSELVSHPVRVFWYPVFERSIRFTTLSRRRRRCGKPKTQTQRPASCTNPRVASAPNLAKPKGTRSSRQTGPVIIEKAAPNQSRSSMRTAFSISTDQTVSMDCPPILTSYWPQRRNPRFGAPQSVPSPTRGPNSATAMRIISSGMWHTGFERRTISQSGNASRNVRRRGSLRGLTNYLSTSSEPKPPILQPSTN